MRSSKNLLLNKPIIRVDVAALAIKEIQRREIAKKQLEDRRKSLGKPEVTPAFEFLYRDSRLPRVAVGKALHGQSQIGY